MKSLHYNLFDYFPTVKLDSKVDIEVDTITKFEDASVTGFTIENPGINYQVNDRLVFDNTDTDGSGVSARVSRIKGELQVHILLKILVEIIMVFYKLQHLIT